MPPDIDQELDRLGRMSVGQLLETYRDVFGEPSSSRHKDHLVRQIAWGLQRRWGDGVSERALRRAAELLANGDLRVAAATARPGRPRSPKRPPIPGTVLRRPYKGKVLEVKVLETGYEYQGGVFRTLSAVAKYITGSHWNGNFFFGLPAGTTRKKPR